MKEDNNNNNKFMWVNKCRKTVSEFCIYILNFYENEIHFNGFNYVYLIKTLCNLIFSILCHRDLNCIGKDN